MISTGTDDLLRLARERADFLEAEVRRLRGVLDDLVGYTDRHQLSYETHGHDCYQEWGLLHDHARHLLDQDAPRACTDDPHGDGAARG